MKQILLFIFISFSFQLCARQIEEITFSYWDKPDSTVYFSTPESIDEVKDPINGPENPERETLVLNAASSVK